MRVAIFASRGIRLPDLGPLLPENTSEILAGGPEGIARTVRERFLTQEIPVRELLPDREA